MTVQRGRSELVSMILEYAHSLQNSDARSENCAGDIIEAFLPQFMKMMEGWEQREVHIDDALTGLARACGELMQIAIDRSEASKGTVAELLPEIVAVFATSAGACAVEVEAKLRTSPSAVN